MKNIFTSTVTKIALVSVLTVGAFGLVPMTVSAACTDDIGIKSGKDCAKGDGVQSNLFVGGDSLFKTVTNVLLFLIGAISVIMLIIGGFRYVISGGDSTQIANAKNTILYAVIGIVVALLAYAIVNFVVDSFIEKPGGSGQNGGGDRTKTN